MVNPTNAPQGTGRLLSIFFLSLVILASVSHVPAVCAQAAASSGLDARQAKLLAEINGLLDDLHDKTGQQYTHVPAIRQRLEALLASDAVRRPGNLGNGTQGAPANYEQAYAACANLSNAALVRALRDLVGNHTSVTYRRAREILFLELDNLGGQVECVYTGRRKGVTSIPNSDDMNVEHSWPQSLGATGVAKSDLHHLFTTDSRANSERGSLPFGEVNGGDWAEGGSECDGSRFEVRPEQRGNTARALFYFAVRYGKAIDPRQEQVLRQWHLADPPDAGERRRNDGIQSIQHNRNPFVDRPEFVDQIADF